MTRISEGGASAAWERYPRFLTTSAGILAALFAAGYLPTARLAGEEGIMAMATGGGTSLVGSLAGTVPLVMSRSRTPIEAMPVLIGSIALRMVVVVALAALVAWAAPVATKPFLVWVAVSHAGLLVADTIFARGVVRAKDAPIADRRD